MGSATSKFLGRAMKAQFARYFAVGAVGTTVDWAIFYLLAIMLGVYYQFSLIFSFSMGAVINYTLNKMFTFRCKSRRVARQFMTFFSLAVICLLLSMMFMHIFVEMTGMQKMLSRVLTTFITLVIGYVLQKSITFNRRFFS
jgi:putative flippase GtrA